MSSYLKGNALRLVTKTSQLIKFREKIESTNVPSVYSEKFSKHINKLCGQSAGNVNVKRDDTCSYYCHLKNRF
jgi:hypothetical protein